MGEVAEMFDVNLSLIRYWESKFDILRPKKNKKGNRMFRPEDIENLRIIYHLVKECGMTLEGAQRAMKHRGKEDVSRSAELMERLQTVKSMLAEMRDMLGEEGGTMIDEDLQDGEVPAAAAENDAPAETETAAEKIGVTVIEPSKAQRRRAENVADKRAELPFYEQTLF